MGHTGPICDVCKKGWAKSDGKCYKCLTSTGVKARSYFLTALIPIIISFVTFFITYKFELLTLDVILQYSKVNNRNKVISELLILRLLQTPLQLFYLSEGFQPFLALPSL